MKSWWKYSFPVFSGIAIIILFVLIGILLTSLFGPSTETGYTGMLIGMIVGVPIGGFISGRIATKVSLPLNQWAKILLATPGFWIAAMCLVFQLAEFGTHSEYVIELIVPCILGVAISM